MNWQSLMRKREAVVGVYLIIMHVVASHSQTQSPSVLQDCPRLFMVYFFQFNPLLPIKKFILETGTKSIFFPWNDEFHWLLPACHATIKYLMLFSIFSLYACSLCLLLLKILVYWENIVDINFFSKKNLLIVTQCVL